MNAGGLQGNGRAAGSLPKQLPGEHPMTDSRPQDLPVGAVDASGEPMDVAGITPPAQPPMVDADGNGDINGEDTDDLEVQGGE